MSVFAIARQAALVLALAGLATPVLAAPVGDPDEQIISGRAVTRSTVVRFADLDLNQGADRARLDRRITVAAASVCMTPDATLIDDPMDFRRCHERAIAGALATLPPAVRLAATSASTSTLLR